MNNIASGDCPFLNSIISDNNGNTARFISFYKNNSGLGLLISNSYGSFVTVANDNRGFVPPDYKFPSSKSNCTLLNKWGQSNSRFKIQDSRSKIQDPEIKLQENKLQSNSSSKKISSSLIQDPRNQAPV